MSKGTRLKKCPVCGAQSFEDIEICYACMHQFKSDQQPRLDLPVVEGVPMESIVPKEERAKHRIIQGETQTIEKIEAEYKLVVSLIPHNSLSPHEVGSSR